MRTAIYTRISNDPTGKAAGVQRQETDCRDLVTANGWDLVGVWTDNDRSATDRKKRRERFEDLIGAVKVNQIDAIVVWHVDRLYRQPRELEDLIDAVESGLLTGGIHTVMAGDIDLSTASGRLVAGMLVQVSKHEVDRTRERLVAMNRHAAAAGKRVGGRRAFGYEQDGYTARTSEADVLNEAVDKVLAGESVRSISIDLNDRGIKTAGGGDFTPSRLRDVLRNSRYAGMRTYKGEIVAEADWPALIDRVRWERLQAILNDPSRRTTPGPTPRHLLSGFLWCGKCGAKLTTRQQHRKSGYGCKPTKSGGCGGVVVTAGPIEKQVTDWLFAVLDDPRLSEALTESETHKDEDSTGAVAEITDIETRMDDLATAYADGEITRRQLATASERLHAKLDAVRSQLVPRRPALAAIDGWASAEHMWQTRGLEFQRELLAAIVDRIVVNPSTTRGSNKHDQSRVVIHPRT